MRMANPLYVHGLNFKYIPEYEKWWRPPLQRQTKKLESQYLKRGAYFFFRKYRERLAQKRNLPAAHLAQQPDKVNSWFFFLGLIEKESKDASTSSRWLPLVQTYNCKVSNAPPRSCLMQWSNIFPCRFSILFFCLCTAGGVRWNMHGGYTANRASSAT